MGRGTLEKWLKLHAHQHTRHCSASTSRLASRHIVTEDSKQKASTVACCTQQRWHLSLRLSHERYQSSQPANRTDRPTFMDGTEQEVSTVACCTSTGSEMRCAMERSHMQPHSRLAMVATWGAATRRVLACVYYRRSCVTRVQPGSRLAVVATWGAAGKEKKPCLLPVRPRTVTASPGCRQGWGVPSRSAV